MCNEQYFWGWPYTPPRGIKREVGEKRILKKKWLTGNANRRNQDVR